MIQKTEWRKMSIYLWNNLLKKLQLEGGEKVMYGHKCTGLGCSLALVEHYKQFIYIKCHNYSILILFDA